MLQETGDLLAKGRAKQLSSGHLNYRKLADINAQSYNEGAVIQACEFHPESPIALVAGLNGTASLFQVDGNRNKKIHTINFRNYPIQTAHFGADGKEFIVGSKHFPHFFVYDLGSGHPTRYDLARKLGQGCMQRFCVSPEGKYIAFHGRFGHIHLMNARTKDHSFSLKMNEPVSDVTFSPDGELLYSHGGAATFLLRDVVFLASCV